MENKFIKYYGEYSLKYWIKLLLKSDIILPDFQRPYEWTKDQVKSLINSLINNQFVSPIIIGKYVEKNNDKSASDKKVDNKRKKDEKNVISKNYILDGQQRLLSLLFAYFSIFPKKVDLFTSDFNDNVQDDSYDYDSSDTNEKVYSSNKVLEYVQKVVKKKNKYSKSELKNIFDKDNNFEKWKDIINDASNNENYYENRFLPFIYIKPLYNITEDSEIISEKKYYAKLFYNINAKGKPLSVQDSRNAIIWSYGGELAEFLKIQIKIKIAKETRNLDFLYYLSIASYIYTQVNDANKKIEDICKILLKGKTTKVQKEQFILDFVNNIENKENINIFGDFEKIFTDISKVKIRLNEYIKELGNEEIYHYDSIEDFEYRFFGILYWAIFNGKEKSIKNYEEKIKNCLNDLHKNFKNNIEQKNNYYKSINTISVLRQRIEESIKIYGENNARD